MKQRTLLLFFLLLSTITTSAQTDLTGATVTLNPNAYDYDGTAHCPKVSGIRKGTKRYNSLVEGTDYDISYEDNVNAGQATATLVFKGDYTGIATQTYTINPLDLTSKESVVLLLDVDEVNYDGTEQKPAASDLYYEGILLVSGVDDDLSYKNNTNPGTASVTAFFKGNYTGSKNTSFTILPTLIDGIYYDFNTSTKEAKVISGNTKYTGSVIIPSSIYIEYNKVIYSVTSIGEVAFKGCDGLTSVTIPNSVKSIGRYAFCDCSNLTSVTIPNSVTWIGLCVFSDCKGLTSVTIPNSVKSIGNWAFSGCSGLTSVIIPNSVTSIDSYAFSGCYIEREKFVNNSGLDAGANNYWGLTFVDSRKNGFIISNGVLIKYTGSESSIAIPNSVTTIGDWAFSGCSGLTSVTIPNSVISIGENAFNRCSGLKSVISEISVPFTFGSNAFSNISPNCVLTVPYGTKDTYVANGWTTNVFMGDIKEVLPEVNGIYYNFDDNTKQAIVTAGDIKYAGSVTIPTIVTYNDVNYNVSSIADRAFQECSDLTSLTIPNSVTSIGGSAFFSCSKLTEVTIGSGVKTIGNDAFVSCTELIDVYCYARKGPTASDGIFSNSGIQFATLHVPETSVNGYKTTTPWSGFGNIVALQDSDPTPDSELEPEPEPEPTSGYIRGDVNLDGEVGMPDVMFLVQYILNGKFPDEDTELEKAGVRFGFYETIPGYSVKINEIKTTGLGVAEFGSDIIGSTIGTSADARTWDRADGSFTNVYFKDANEDPEMVVEVDFTMIADDGSGETINQKAITTVKLQDLTQWQPNKNYTFIYKILLAPLYMIEDLEPIISLDSVVVEGQGGSTR